MNTAKTRVYLRQLQDGPPHNSVMVQAVMLEVKVLGSTKPIEVRLGTFSDEYAAIAKEFCEWFNAKGHAMMAKGTPWENPGGVG